MEIFDQKMAQRLKQLRADQQLSLDQLSKICDISRATLSRLENASVSPTAALLGKLCAAYGISMSRLMSMVEADFAPLILAAAQTVWTDPETGYSRQMISPPTSSLTAEMLKCHLPAGQKISYPAPPRQGLEHHLYLLNGALSLDIDGVKYHLNQGDCLRYQLFANSQFKTPSNLSADYILTLI